MMRQGPIPALIHGMVEYAAGALFVAAPFLFGFDSGAAQAVSIVVGVAILVVTSASNLPTGLAKIIPVGIHVVLDVGTAAFLIAAPFLFGFSDESAPTAWFIVLGVLHVLLTIGTRFTAGQPAA
jgi:VIT1/CCC1 family predicted Fe2+/Mn2+ transporter